MDRRKFVGAAGAAFTVMKPELVRGTQRNSAVRLALFGCGGRGTGVAGSFLANTTAVVTALGDLFEGQIAKAKDRLDTAAAKASKPVIDRSRLFSGPDSLERLLGSQDMDAVLIATPPYFHPEHLAKAVTAGKHVYCEKPVAVDVAGCQAVIATGKSAQGRLSLAIGFQLRHAPPYVQIRERIRQGDLGAVVCGLSHYYAGAIRRPEWPNASPQERRLRNWIHDKVISGDIFVEQNIHLVDLNNWLLGAQPLSAQGTCGRRGRRDQGDCSSHFNVTFTYPNDVHVTVTSTQFIEGEWDVAVRLFGEAGNAELRYDAPVRITGRKPWNAPGVGKPEKTETAAAVTGAFKGAIEDADAEKERHWIESITSGRYINEAEQGAESTLSAILGRTAAYTGRSVTFEEVVQGGERWEAGLDVRRL